MHILHIAHSDKPVPFYSLDVVISVGYRVKSRNGIIFRRWANSILKQYLLKGYAINENRTLVTNENYIKVEVKLIDNNVWLNQDQIVTLYQSSKSNISEHIKHILEEGELDSDSVVRNFRITATDGKFYNVKQYNEDK